MSTTISIIIGVLAGIIAGGKLFNFIKNFFEDKKLEGLTKELKNKEVEIEKSKEELNIQKGKVENVKEDFYNKLNKYNDTDHSNKQR